METSSPETPPGKRSTSAAELEREELLDPLPRLDRSRAGRVLLPLPGAAGQLRGRGDPAPLDREHLRPAQAWEAPAPASPQTIRRSRPRRCRAAAAWLPLPRRHSACGPAGAPGRRVAHAHWSTEADGIDGRVWVIRAEGPVTVPLILDRPMTLYRPALGCCRTTGAIQSAASTPGSRSRTPMAGARIAVALAR